MGRATRSATSHGRTPRTATLVKKALSIAPRALAGIDAQPRPGAQTGGRSGKRRPGHDGSIDWLATLLQGRPRRRQDLQRKPRSSAQPQLWLVVLDASASTRRHGALSQAKGLLTELFEQAYRARVRIALLDAHGTHAQWHWQGQKASAALQGWLNELGAGGGSPLIPALQQAHEWLTRRQRAKPAERQHLLVITDGRLREWPALPISPCSTLVVDIESAPVRIGKAHQLAEQLAADYRHIETLATLS